ncbi:MAG TPA: hypothetical protein VEI58_02100 [Chthoniobacterales bacterium]|nr:hypothetical protein [Chthoniobacterales bacterium]
MNIRAVVVVAFICTSSGTIFAADDPFIGNWKLDPAKSQTSGFQEKIEDLGHNRYRFTINNRAEEIVADGQDHPTSYGTWALKQESPNKWTSIDKKNGRVISTTTWTISDDNKTFVAVTQGLTNDGSTYRSQFTAKRLAGDSGLVGTWGRADEKHRMPADWQISRYQENGLSLFSPTEREAIDAKFDGKDYPDDGPHVPIHSTVSIQRIDARNLIVYGKVDGQLVYTARWQVSDDGSMLAIGMNRNGVTISETNIYNRQ